MELIERADAYLKAEPTLHALRMCHRFGKGINVHITKLPNEIEQIVESCLASAQIRRGSMLLWDCSWEFTCFQSECSPVGHCSEAIPLLESAYDNLELCVICDEDSIWGDKYVKCKKRCTSDTKDKCAECSDKLSDDCVRGCRSLYDKEVNEVCGGFDFYLNDHMDHKSGWRARIKQGPGGAFQKFLMQVQRLYLHDGNNVLTVT